MISAFTIVRNARILDYPFEESVLSALPLCDEFVIVCGDSDDNTLEICQRLSAKNPKVRVISSVWERQNQTGGFQLKLQTDRALQECKGDWCLYIQADEVFHEMDYGKVREALAKASASSDVDGILFDYLHFYASYDYTIRGRNWYRHEVRAFKNGRGISAFRDAQGFRKNGEKLKVIRSGARVFHYGYVRSAASMGKKSGEMSQWWGEKPTTEARKLLPKRHVGLTRFKAPHPLVMEARIRGTESDFDPRKCPRVWDRKEFKNAITLLWESVFHFRIGEFRNYEVIG